jgi:hypothetical protein
MATSIPVPEADYVPPGPERPVAVAHASQEVGSEIAHASRHADAAAAAASPERVKFNLEHCAAHIRGGIAQQNSSISNLIQLDPRAGDELARLRDTASPARSSWQYAPPGPARGKTPAHLAQTVLVALSHARQHCSAAQAARDPENLDFDISHLRSHLDEALDHQRKYCGAIAEFFPAVAAELDALGKLSDLGKLREVAGGKDARMMLVRLLADGPLGDDELDDRAGPGEAIDGQDGGGYDGQAAEYDHQRLEESLIARGDLDAKLRQRQRRAG